ncbi:PIG-L family deacetylase [Candidatus Pacearchaeota archaeon]|nr:PIG-L family deacetylase [Candidatus Pacearchaeota archaeon]
MHNLRLIDKTERALTILCLGAHGDDIEIGCGGTLMKLQEECPALNVHWIVFSHSSNAQRKGEICDSADAFLRNAEKNVVVQNFRDGFFPYVGDKIKEYFEQLKSQLNPDIIFTHYRNDLHQDHRLISSLTWNTFRSHLILEYEIPKYDGDLGSPNLFVSLSEDVCRNKTEYLLKYFCSQNVKHWFKEDVFLSILRIRGVECNSPSKYAEAFYGHKLVI